ncbi:MAG: hypothetical protein K8T91_08850 [Planctomycetes bacterium]|nr:hypothetical protein [Planctomycetota bacterium]
MSQLAETTAQLANKIIINTTLIPADPPPLCGRFEELRALFVFSAATCCSATGC